MEKFISVSSKYLTSIYAKRELSLKTKANYQGYFNNVIMYLSENKIEDILIDDIDFNLMEDFRVWLRKDRGIDQTVRTLELCKNTLEYARQKGLIYSNQLQDLDTRRAPAKEKVILNVDELLEFAKKEHLVRDLYIFTCYTGMSYGDLWTFRIKRDAKGEWINNRRNKNGTEYWVPLFPEAKEILERYNYKFPFIANWPYNQTLRELAKDITYKHLTTHTARKTFATRMYEEGWSAEAISDMMGISVQVLFKHYIKRSRKRIEQELLRINK
jgi:integrase/recombinase XerD